MKTGDNGKLSHRSRGTGELADGRRTRQRAAKAAKLAPAGEPTQPAVVVVIAAPPAPAAVTVLKPKAAAAPPAVDLDASLAGLKLQRPQAAALEAALIYTVGDLIGRSEAELLKLDGIGQGTVNRIKSWLAGQGLYLKDSPRPQAALAA